MTERFLARAFGARHWSAARYSLFPNPYSLAPIPCSLPFSLCRARDVQEDANACQRDEYGGAA